MILAPSHSHLVLLSRVTLSTDTPIKLLNNRKLKEMAIQIKGISQNLTCQWEGGSKSLSYGI